MRHSQNSNVVQFLAMLKKDDPSTQLVYYQVIPLGPHVNPAVLMPSRQAGIGTYTSSVLKTPIIEGTSKLLDQMIAYNLPDHIKGLSFPPHVLPLTMPDQSFQTAISF